LREQGGFTLREAAAYLERDPSTLSRFESGEHAIRRADLLMLLDFYPVPDQRRRENLLALREEVWRKGWWEGYGDDVDRSFADLIWLESRASEIRTFADAFVPGLLQTRDYARAVIEADERDPTLERVEQFIEIRMARQQVLAGDDPVRLHAIIDEAVLRRAVGGPAVMRAQLEHLLTSAQQPHIDVRVLPLRAGAHPNPAGMFSVFTMPEPYPRVAHKDTLAGSLYAESPGVETFGWVYDRLAELALGSSESTGLISEIAKEYGE
jgi:transcriptional regulator with XRE-family HTH domain